MHIMKLKVVQQCFLEWLMSMSYLPVPSSLSQILQMTGLPYPSSWPMGTFPQIAWIAFLHFRHLCALECGLPQTWHFSKNNQATACKQCNADYMHWGDYILLVLWDHHIVIMTMHTAYNMQLLNMTNWQPSIWYIRFCIKY